MLRFVPAKNAGDEIGCGGKGRLRLIALRRVAAFRQHQRVSARGTWRRTATIGPATIWLR